MWEGSVWILMDPYGPVWVRMVPGDSLGASWGLLGPWGAQKGGYRPVSPPGGGAGGPSWEACLLAYVGSSLICPLRAAYVPMSVQAELSVSVKSESVDIVMVLSLRP